MHFLKRNGLNIIIFILLFGVIGMLINMLMPASSYEYEAYYTIEGEVSPNTSGELNILMNENVNNQFVEKTVKIEHYYPSNIIQVNIDVRDRSIIGPVISQVNELITGQGYSMSEMGGSNIYLHENTMLKIFITIFSLFIGLIVGLLVSLLNKNISTDEDYEHYLTEKVLGTF